MKLTLLAPLALSILALPLLSLPSTATAAPGDPSAPREKLVRTRLRMKRLELAKRYLDSSLRKNFKRLKTLNLVSDDREQIDYAGMYGAFFWSCPAKKDNQSVTNEGCGNRVLQAFPNCGFKKQSATATKDDYCDQSENGEEWLCVATTEKCKIGYETCVGEEKEDPRPTTHNETHFFNPVYEHYVLKEKSSPAELGKADWGKERLCTITPSPARDEPGPTTGGNGKTSEAGNAR